MNEKCDNTMGGSKQASKQASKKARKQGRKEGSKEEKKEAIINTREEKEMKVGRRVVRETQSK